MSKSTVAFPQTESQTPPEIVKIQVARNVYQCIAMVSAAMAKQGIGKDRKNQQQGYSFRGIDDVYNALAPLLAETGLVILPRIVSRECVERTSKSGTAQFYVTVKAEFDFVSVWDGSKHVVETFGEAQDSGDKATNKAMSAAYKYAAFQTFCIPTEGDNDADARTPEPSKPSAPAGYDAWLAEFKASSGNGLEALRVKWKTAKVGHRNFLTATNPGLVDELKAKAVNSEIDSDIARAEEPR